MLGQILSYVWSRFVLVVLFFSGKQRTLLAEGKTKLSYMMEDAEESRRLEEKTDLVATERQLRWGGLKPGMRALDLGCGMGVVSNVMAQVVGDDGYVLGIDGSAERIADARSKYLPREGLEFRQSMFDDLASVPGGFDFIWCRFVLQFLPNPEAVIQQAVRLLKPGGVLCVGELDYNSLSHHPLPPRVERVLMKMVALSHGKGLDFYMGRRLYTMFRVQGLEQVDVEIEAHHCIYGSPCATDRFNWLKKVSKMSRLIPLVEPWYPRGRRGFVDDFMTFFDSEHSFTYTPLIKVRGQRPMAPIVPQRRPLQQGASNEHAAL